MMPGSTPVWNTPYSPYIPTPRGVTSLVGEHLGAQAQGHDQGRERYIAFEGAAIPHLDPGGGTKQRAGAKHNNDHNNKAERSNKERKRRRQDARCVEI